MTNAIVWCRGRARAAVGAALVGAFAALVTSSAIAQDEITRFPAKGVVPPGYPQRYAAVIAAAEQEGKLVIHSTTDLAIARSVIDDFQSLYPRIEVQYQDLNSSDLYNGYLDDLQTSPTTADILWSSAMDLQLRLANAGQALAYESPEASGLPAWAAFRSLAFGTTYEPIAIAYDKRQLAADEVPKTHADVTRLLTEKRQKFAGKVVTYDIERSGLGFLLATQDQKASGTYWDLARALGEVGVRVLPTTEAMLGRVAKGEDVLSYNALGSYAQRQVAAHPSLGIVFPEDYTLVVTRVMLIGKKAANPNAAKLWVDYLLSRRGQTVLAERAGLAPLRTDLTSNDAVASLAKSLGAQGRPIPLGSALIEPFPTREARIAFVRQWQQAVGVKR